MSLEKRFLEETRKLKQKKKKLITYRFGVFSLIVAIITGVVYLFHLGNSIFRTSITIPSMSITMSLLSIIGLIFSIILFIYVVKHQASKSHYKSSLFPLKFLQFNWIDPKKRKYLFGWSVLLITLIYQANPSLVNHPVNSFMTRLVSNPKPPLSNSPWPWKEHEMIHPVVANMPSHVETSIDSVAKYIAQQESDPYLRVKALHDYVISRVTYDLEVLKTGRRPAQDAQTVFSTHKAVCEGYANLFMELGKAIGVDVVVIEGRIRRDLAPIDLIPKFLRLLNSNYDWTLHAWNAVKILDSWQLVDTTWDDTNSAESISSYHADYLMPPPKVMNVSHFPDLTDWQLLDSPIDHKTFENLPLLTPQFFIDELALISPTEYQTNVQKAAFIKIKSSPNYQKRIVAIFTKTKETNISLWDLTEDNQSSQRKKQDIRMCQSQQNAAGETQIYCQFPEPGDYQVIVLSLRPRISLIGQLEFQSK